MNALGPWALTVALAPLLRRSPAGRVVNVSSEAGSLASMGDGHATYAVSKAALNAATILLADGLRRDGVLVNAVCPGWVRTDMGGSAAPRSVGGGRGERAVGGAPARRRPDRRLLPRRPARALVGGLPPSAQRLRTSRPTSSSTS